MKFIDQTEIKISSGDGGSGTVSFKTARNKPKLGPDGGNGGDGADVIAVCNKDLNTLSTFRFQRIYKAEHGGKGGVNCRTGKCGQHLRIGLPLGTLIFDQETGDMIGEIVSPDDEIILAKGGKRGFGNVSFITPSRQAPNFATSGKKGESKSLRLELKLFADVGLTGLPNAGKSTLLSRLTSAKPKIADYPFTTLTPQLGVVDLGQGNRFEQSFVMADIPGLIEGASLGKGLGHEFLRHIERTKILLFVIDGFSFATEELSPLEALQILKKELGDFNPQLLRKKCLIAINKMDLADPDTLAKVQAKSEEMAKLLSCEVVFISGTSGSGLDTLLYKLKDLLQS